MYHEKVVEMVMVLASDGSGCVSDSCISYGSGGSVASDSGS